MSGARRAVAPAAAQAPDPSSAFEIEFEVACSPDAPAWRP